MLSKFVKRTFATNRNMNGGNGKKPSNSLIVHPLYGGVRNARSTRWMQMGDVMDFAKEFFRRTTGNAWAITEMYKQLENTHFPDLPMTRRNMSILSDLETKAAQNFWKTANEWYGHADNNNLGHLGRHGIAPEFLMLRQNTTLADRAGATLSKWHRVQAMMQVASIGTLFKD